MRRLAALAGALALAALALALHATDAELATPVDLAEVAYVGSGACRRCHEERHASWYRTYHRTMTQEASDEAVLGDFDDAALHYLGWDLRFTRDSDGSFSIRAQSAASDTVTWRVDRTVGSHRVQQYLAREGDEWLRLPVAWHVEEARWFPMNGAFLTPDPPAPASRADLERHVTRWNDNCVFCHNVAPRPGRTPDGRFRTEVAELGIACEACHGPGAEHVARNASPLRRYALHLSDRDDPSLVTPAELDASRASDVCGRCHGQRKTDDLDGVLRDGDPFLPGDDLSRHSEPLWADTTINGGAPFEARFWADDTPRLTAYEYQGWLLSPCGRDPSFGCGSCHAMHEGSPEGQLKPSARGDGACTSCHAMEEDHARHPQTTVACVDCHMPRVVYGVIDAHRSHRVEIPRPREQAAARRPDACTLCHVGESRAWADAALADRWGGPRATTFDGDGAHPDDDTMEPTARTPLDDVFGGDPIVRALTADALGRAALGEPAMIRAVLLDVMRHDPYPAVRRLAFRALRRTLDPAPAWDAFDPTGSAALRETQCDTLAAGLALAPLDAERVAALRAQASSDAIWIGE